jgi:hypothetical protein
MTDYVATRTGNRTRVKLSTGWTLAHDDGEQLADISDPDRNVIDSVRIFAVGMGHRPLDPSGRGRTPTVEDLVATLVAYVRDDHLGPRICPPPGWEPRLPLLDGLEPL